MAREVEQLPDNFHGDEEYDEAEIMFDETLSREEKLRLLGQIGNTLGALAKHRFDFDE